MTGASAGIGASTAELFAKCGSNVVLMARRADKLQAVKAKCEAAHKESGLKKGGKVVVIEADMQKNEHLDAIPGKLEGLEVDMSVCMVVDWQVMYKLIRVSLTVLSTMLVW